MPPTFERMAAGGGPGSGVGGQAGRQQERPPPQGSHGRGSDSRQKNLRPLYLSLS